MRSGKLMLALATIAMSASVVTSAIAQTKEQFFPLLSYRTGPYAPNGVPWANGKQDYLKLINARDGGVNGVKMTYEECETGYATDRGVAKIFMATLNKALGLKTAASASASTVVSEGEEKAAAPTASKRARKA